MYHCSTLLLKGHCHIFRTLSLDPILSQLNLVHNVTQNFSNISLLTKIYMHSSVHLPLVLPDLMTLILFGERYTFYNRKEHHHTNTDFSP